MIGELRLLSSCRCRIQLSEYPTHAHGIATTTTNTIIIRKLNRGRHERRGVGVSVMGLAIDGSGSWAHLGFPGRLKTAYGIASNGRYKYHHEQRPQAEAKAAGRDGSFCVSHEAFPAVAYMRPNQHRRTRLLRALLRAPRRLSWPE